ncbi:MAG: hypothetical protein ACRYHQ_03550 [Janthinobacterium lividum]
MARFTTTLGAAALVLGSLATLPALAQTGTAAPAPASSAPAASAPAAPMSKPMASGTATKPAAMKGKSSMAMKHPLHYAARHHGMGTPHQARSALAGHNQAVDAQDAGTARLNEQSLASARGGSAGAPAMSGTMPMGSAPMSSPATAPMRQSGPGGDQSHQPPADRGASVSTNH